MRVKRNALQLEREGLTVIARTATARCIRCFRAAQIDLDIRGSRAVGKALTEPCS